MKSAIKIAPSILAADFSRLGEQVKEATDAGADYIHIDIMDGHFVPNLTMGPVVVKSIRHVTHLPFDLHLMIESPELFIPRFVEAGANLITVHVEACLHLHRVVEQINSAGVKAGVGINPHTPIVALEEILPYVAEVNVMTVNPGFGGQKFIATMLPKVERLRKMIEERNLDVDIEVDGGVTKRTAPRCVRAGANVLIAGTSVFQHDETIREHIRGLRESADKAKVSATKSVG
ncbi:MAG TPA: ribulose-phosphate 3-epimerase [Anaerolineae bacterium]|nr:ribulose-phosphate 3-epimerase [Anaerolineae bacterium]